MCESTLTNLTSRCHNLVGVVLVALFTGTLAIAVCLVAAG
jgi:hypothetical protein